MTTPSASRSTSLASVPREGLAWPRGVYWWSTALAIIVFPLIWVGGLVTTTDAGMAVPDWPNTYGYNLFLYPWYDWVFGPWDLFVEHGHRLLASLAGVVTIGVFILAWRIRQRRPELLRLSAIALAMVIAQGILGGLRVVLDQRTLAMIHGCFGPAYFVVVICLHVVASPWWLAQERREETDPSVSPRGLKTLSTVVLAMAFGQLILGANLRHVSEIASPGWFQSLVILHVGLACAVLVASSCVAWACQLRALRPVGIRLLGWGLIVAVLAQIVLGIGTWTVKYGYPWVVGDWQPIAGFTVVEKSFLQVNLVTGHVAVGSLILALSAALVCRTFRVTQLAERRHACEDHPDRASRTGPITAVGAN